MLIIDSFPQNRHCLATKRLRYHRLTASLSTLCPGALQLQDVIVQDAAAVRRQALAADTTLL